MSIYDSKLWISDIDKTIKKIPELVELENKFVLITGATGLICSAVIDILSRRNETHRNKIKILAAGRSEEKMQNRFSCYFDADWFDFTLYDAASLNNNFRFSCDYIIHGASNASPNKISSAPVETMLSNFIGTYSLLEYAKINNVKRLLFISSSEVYGKKEVYEPYKVNEYGYIDLLNSRNSYSNSKRAAETLCISYFGEILRDNLRIYYNFNTYLFQETDSMFTNTINWELLLRESGNYCINAAKGEDIVMKSSGMQIRSYCYCLDCASAILKVLLRGKVGNVYNISNRNSIISIKDMAEILVKHAGIKLVMDVPSEEEKKVFNPMINSSLNSDSLYELGWEGLFDAETGFAHTINILKTIIE